MKNLRTITVVLFVSTISITGIRAFAASASEELQRGLYAEEVEGNMTAAIKSYESVIKNGAASPNLAAQALYREAMCYMKLRDDASARADLEKLVENYPGQAELVEKVKPILDDLANFDPATLMPPDTLIYVEFGTPGRQIETVLGMLKGTPFENPLAAINGPQSPNPGQKSPGDIVAALLNPSMMTEFKKIRGSAIGITGFADNHPLMVSVLYPGKSDALRGVILAGLGMAGTPGETLDGMQTVRLPEGLAAAYDDRVVIVARPESQLAWSVKRYKGLNSEPSLASRNSSFAKLSKMDRQKNALTVWAKVDQAYSRVVQMFPPGAVPRGLMVANGVIDFNNVDQFLLTDSIDLNSCGSRAEIQFKQGHQCLAYEFIHTPNISKAPFEAVPANAIAIASFALNSGGGVQSDAARAGIRDVTGLDVGREIFANIEQAVVFVMPAATNEAAAGIPEALRSQVGVAITSRDPAQTRSVLDRVLGTAALVTGGNEGGGTNRYKVGSTDKGDVYCYVDQANGITILSLNPGINAAAVSAMEGRRSVLASGPLHDAVSKLDPATSKLALVNVGGALRLLGAQFPAPTKDPNQEKQWNASLHQLAQATASSTLELRTEEQINRFAMSSSLIGVPPLNQVFGPATELSRIGRQAHAESVNAELRRETPATIVHTSREPSINGSPDQVWIAAQAYPLTYSLYTPPTSPDDLSAEFRALWDETNLFVRVDVTDDVLRHDSGPAKYYEDDCVEIFIDSTDGKSTGYNPTDYHFAFNWDKTSPTMQEVQHHSVEGVQYVMTRTEQGYRLETKIPWSTLGVKPAVGSRIGLDVHVDDNDKGGKRDSKITWHARQDDAWENPQRFGNAELAGLVGWWKLDETSGAVAADSSGNGNSGSLQGHPAWRPGGGRIGGAIELNGHGDYVRIDNKAPFDITGQVTVSAWVNIRSVPQEWTGIVTKGDTAWRLSTASAQNAFHFGLAPQDFLNGHLQVSPGAWHHVACVYDGQAMSLYVDGNLDASRPRSGPIGSNQFPVCIGENMELTGRGWDGLIDDVRVYNCALSKSRIQALAAGENEDR